MPEPSTPPRWELGPRPGPADLPALRAELRALVLASPTAVVICDVGAVSGPDAGTLDVLARLQLDARRLGGRLVLDRVGGRLRLLLDLTGLGAVLEVLEHRRQPEQGEQVLGVQEGVDSADPAG